MVNHDQNKKYLFEFDEKGTIEVSQQIMNSYNSGFIGEGTALAESNDFAGTES
ncbi:hypothetical protein SAMN05444673_5368 [Bacillus sp. OV166]|uniref:hypothetical protein n=1 Tax=Bacillaceae TaxID=186817 RepID=UPI000A2AE4D8|nr:hypothetical protein [Bacillus sp. OV166]SMQ83442.1 hypothetical protein SAMN05444673_5368 [Bacillus sp. OV166]